MYISNEVNWLKYLKGKSVAIFGAGRIGRDCAKKLQKVGILVRGFIDNNQRLPRILDNLPLRDFDSYLADNTDISMIVICSQSFEREMKEQLLSADIHNFISATQIDFGGGVEHYDEDYFKWQKPMGEFGANMSLKMFFAPYVKESMTVVEFGSAGGGTYARLYPRKRWSVSRSTSTRAGMQKSLA